MSRPDLGSYDRILVMVSGGKDSVASLCELLDAGVPPSRIELWHHDVDGGGEPFMDWPSTRRYVEAVGDRFGLPVFHSWRAGGFLREMLRDESATAPVVFDTLDGRRSVGGAGPTGTRLRFPQVGADLRTRWCSAALKIDVADAAIRGQDRFLGSRTLVVTGERAEESPGRGRYAPFEPHRTDTRQGARRRRHVDHWRPVHHLREADVWDRLRRHRIAPALPYRLGFSRHSCMFCIFMDAPAAATVRYIARDWFGRLAAYETRFSCTIKRAIGLHDLADRGEPFPAAVARPDLIARALSADLAQDARMSDWHLPAGAFGQGAGPV